MSETVFLAWDGEQLLGPGKGGGEGQEDVWIDVKDVRSAGQRRQKAWKSAEGFPGLPPRLFTLDVRWSNERRADPRALRHRLFAIDHLHNHLNACDGSCSTRWTSLCAVAVSG